MVYEVTLKDLSEFNDYIRIGAQENLVDILIRASHEGEHRRIELLEVLKNAVEVLDKI